MTAEVKNVYESYLNVQSPFLVTNNVEFIEYRDISAQKEQLNGESRSVTFNIDYVDDYIYLEKSYFVMDIDLVKTDGSRYTDSADIALTNNGLMYLFNHAEFRIDSVLIESFNHPGLTTTIAGLLKYDYGTTETVGQDFGWTIDNFDYSAKGADNPGFKARSALILKGTSTIGNYKFIVPFTHIFGTAGKVLRGARVKITFLRSSSLDSNAIYKTSVQASNADTVADGKIEIKDMIFMVAVPRLNEGTNAHLTEYFASKPLIPFQFLVKHLEIKEVNTSKGFNWNLSFSSKDQKLVGIVVGFQTDREKAQKKNAAVFDNLKAEHAEVQLNGITYPGSVLNSLDTESCTDLYVQFKEFRKMFSTGFPEADSIDFKTVFPIHCFNLMHQKVKTLNDPYNVGLRFRFKNNVAANTICYALFFFEKYLTFTTYGDTKMTPMVM